MKAVEVDDLGDEDHRREGADTSKTAERPDRRAIGRLRRKIFDGAIELGAPAQGLIESLQRSLERAREGGVGEVLRPDPAPMRLTPVFARVIHTPVPGQELEHAMAPADNIGPDIVTTAREIPEAFLIFRRDVNHRQFAGAEKSHELGRIAAIGLHTLAGSAWG